MECTYFKHTPISPTAELSSSANLLGQGRRSTQVYGPSHTQASTFTNTAESVNLDLGYREVLRRARFPTDFKCSFDRFIELASEDEERALLTQCELLLY